VVGSDGGEEDVGEGAGDAQHESHGDVPAMARANRM
jgi:hypothetical protein